jgi:hypothetical protein
MPATLARFAAPMLAAAALTLAAPRPTHAQEARLAATAPDGSAIPDSSTLRVFVDHCPCRMDYVRTEIPYVDYVRDRTEAQVHVLFTQQRTGSGGRSYTLEFIGHGRFEGRVDTMRLATAQDATDDERRETLVRYLKLGLVPFLTETRAVNQLDVTYRPPDGGAASSTAPAADPWNFWVFRTNVNGSGSSEASSKRISTNGSFTADRTTQQWHLRFFGRSDYTERRYDFTDGTKLTSYTNSDDASAFIVRSRGPHWSMGGTASLHSSTTDNQRDALRLAPAVEYSLFPYSEFQRRQLTATYTLGVTDVNYYEITLYGKTRETLYDQSLRVSWDLTQPWGDFSLGVAGSQYLHDLSKYAVTGSMDGNFRLFRGFSLNMSADASRVNNQLYLPLGQASEQDVLLELRQLATSYRLSGRLGLSYTFGSIFNNIVNPRLGH